ncbi:hypothetical protein OS493_001561 [Desmophyllum pertusum]|uniref:Uncharacterized protein n=1 Tax=Desmophyllum pertusum TaxID=174260 RepID=A0A9W9ZH72_9CNID|nr:hypothetical protein OS493_001561 [Desmophyllum pertusum]
MVSALFSSDLMPYRDEIQLATDIAPLIGCLRHDQMPIGNYFPPNLKFLSGVLRHFSRNASTYNRVPSSWALNVLDHGLLLNKLLRRSSEEGSLVDIAQELVCKELQVTASDGDLAVYKTQLSSCTQCEQIGIGESQS